MRDGGNCEAETEVGREAPTTTARFAPVDRTINYEIRMDSAHKERFRDILHAEAIGFQTSRLKQQQNVNRASRSRPSGRDCADFFLPEVEPHFLGERDLGEDGYEVLCAWVSVRVCR